MKILGQCYTLFYELIVVLNPSSSSNICLPGSNRIGRKFPRLFFFFARARISLETIKFWIGLDWMDGGEIIYIPLNNVTEGK